MEIESVDKWEKVLGISRPEKGFDNASYPKTFDIFYEKKSKENLHKDTRSFKTLTIK